MRATERSGRSTNTRDDLGAPPVRFTREPGEASCAWDRRQGPFGGCRSPTVHLDGKPNQWPRLQAERVAEADAATRPGFLVG